MKKHRKQIHSVALLILFILITGCTTHTNAEVPSLFETEEPKIESSVAITDHASSSDDSAGASHEWNPTEENTFRYLNRSGETNQHLDKWIEAYCTGNYSQVYIMDPDVSIMWRLTCNGTDEYLIEKRSSGADMPTEFCGYSKVVTEGVIYYRFGEDLPEISHLPVTIYKGLTNPFIEIEEDDELWLQQVKISETEAIELAAEIFENNEAQLVYQVHGRYVYWEQCFYYIKLFFNEQLNDARHLYVSADGTVFLEDTTVGLELVCDKAAEKLQLMQ